MTEIHDLNDWDRRIIEEFRANGGNVGGQLAGVPLLLLTTTGAKSGEPHISPLSYLSEGGHIYVLAGNRGAPTNPCWYHNLVAHPAVTVELGTEKFEARATVVDRAEGLRNEVAPLAVNRCFNHCRTVHELDGGSSSLFVES